MANSGSGGGRGSSSARVRAPRLRTGRADRASRAVPF